ncbi:MAG TPA: SDR family NAD(P)-dependent oxidoreductase [Candidatus Limnocylindrales bacterium]|nr:SDR family NAD(P)-dependent oxidoreductase [Candidatus Limnocylindrales bacterium]
MPEEERFDDSLDIAVVGMAARFPKAANVEEFWRNLRDGVCSVTWLSDADLAAVGVDAATIVDPTLVKAAFLLEDKECFDAELFGYSPREAELMDPQHRLLLECGWEALERAGYDPSRYDGLIGVYAGAGMSTYLMFHVATHGDLMETVGGNSVMLGNSNDFLATRLSYKLGLEGPSINTQSACSSSLVSVVLACQGLLSYQCDMALAGGVAVDVLKERGYLYQEDGLYSPDGVCRTFDAKAQGTVGGNGVGLVVLKRLAEAVRDGDHVHAVIKGSALNNDGAQRAGFTAPRADGQALAITTALANAGVEPETIQYVEAHGTATILGDPIEVSALMAAFATGTKEKGFCALGSVKPNIGHLDAAAGIAGLIKTVLAVENGQIPPLLHFEKPNPRLELDRGPFYINTELLPWPQNSGPRRAGVSSFGLGGTNAHVVLEQAPPLEMVDPDGSAQLLVLSARNEQALERLTDRIADYLRTGGARLADTAFTLQTGRKALPHRRILVAASAADAASALGQRDGGRVLSAVAGSAGSRSVAFLFTGFGDQYPNMARQLYDTEPVFRAALDRCAGILAAHLDLRAVLFADPAPSPAKPGIDLRGMLSQPEVGEHPLNRPLYGYPAMFAVEYAMVQLWHSLGVRPEAMLGHSLGEHVAACVSGVFTLEDALMLAVARAKLIEQRPGGAMLAVPLADNEISRFLGDEVWLAAVNAPRTCVLSGSVAAIEAVAQALTAEGVACRRVATEHAFHSPMMRPVAEPYLEILSDVTLHPPAIPFISNMTGTWITAEQATDPKYWAEHMLGTVRFADGMEVLWRTPGVVLVEVGPGQTLSGLALQHPSSRHAPDRYALPSIRPRSVADGDREFLLRSLGQLWLAGVAVDWTALHRGPRRRVTLPTYPFERRRFWLEPRPGGEPGGQRSATRRGEMSTWFSTESWRRLPALGEPFERIAGQRWLVFADEVGLGDGLVERLRGFGAQVTVVRIGDSWSRGERAFTLDVGAPDSYARLAAALRDSGGVPERVVHAWSVDDTGPEPEALLDKTFHSLVRLVQATAGELMTRETRWDVLTSGLYSVIGTERLRPVKATVQGVCKVAPQEYPGLVCRLVDVVAGPVSGALVDQVLRELVSPPAAGAIALRGEHRWLQGFEPSPVSAGGPSPLRPGGVYLITGGLGKIGLELARAMADTAPVRLVLIGRSGLPPDGTDPVVRAVRDLEARGSRVLVLAADVADEPRLRAAVELAVNEFGPINGVLHAAGVTGPKAHRLLTELGPQEIGWHLRPKLHGIYALDRVLAGQPLDFAVLFSSIAALLGGLGFGAYAAANAFMDAYARQGGHAVRWTSWNWEAWRFPEDNADTAGIGAAIQEMAISPREGREVFDRLLSIDQPAQVIISTADLAQRARLWSDPVHGAGSAAKHSRPNLRNPYVAPGTELERQIAGIWADLLGVDQVGIHDNFFELGGSSLLGLQVVHRLRRDLGRAVPLTIVYEGPTVSTLARLIDGMGAAR